MIRVDYPHGGPFHQIRHRLHLATRRTRLALEERRRVLRASDAATESEVIGPRDAALRDRLRADLAHERDGYELLNERYDALVGVLCAAAHEGIEPGMEDEYRALRTWFCAHYPQAKRTLAPFVLSDPSDGVTGRLGRRAACDAFEALFFPHTIAAMLAADGGNLIGRLLRTQEALAAWQRGIRRRERLADAPFSSTPS